jgi:hypothetical protein
LQSAQDPQNLARTLLSVLSSPSAKAWPLIMRYIVQIVRTNTAGEEVLASVKICELGAKRARAKAQLLLGVWRKEGAAGFRLVKSLKRETERLKAS